MKKIAMDGQYQQLDLYDYWKTLYERWLSYSWDHRDGACSFHTHEAKYNYFWNDHEMRAITESERKEINFKCVWNQYYIYKAGKKAWYEIRNQIAFLKIEMKKLNVSRETQEREK